ncbi:hypothetical protein D0T84_03295 [Dysgonomonas sp. 521]|uniref:YiiX/YebB-like N1pC/P60 family cysteine hydrolase n=1 Tax=Dysgonomonas sp. 521 TaxID=2302932 RepID=UPI0013D77A1E|nr:YiiX/YebB-like N1pC/P60 family cysteine hydrolase [Dysgonomonas sp. 521]NDV93944.1 hypothetical protein [Dysgonomonas sp. 521]
MENIIYILFLLYPAILSADDFKLQTGDLVFQESCSGNMGNAIKEVTLSIEQYHFTHVGMVYIDENDSVFVVEATHPRVAATPLGEYLYPKNEKDCYPLSVVGRLKNEYRHIIPQAIREGLTLVGKEYDDGFVMGNDKYYCSEFIYEILLRANNGKPVFPLNIMTFKSPGSDEITEGWKKYFEKLNLPVPEGELGINPGAMSRSDVIDIVHYY